MIIIVIISMTVNSFSTYVHVHYWKNTRHNTDVTLLQYENHSKQQWLNGHSLWKVSGNTV